MAVRNNQNVRAELIGGEALEQVLKQLPREVKKQVIKSAVGSGAQLLKREARKNVLANGSYETGLLYRSIVARKKKGTNDWYQVGVLETAPHARLVEYGTSPRKLRQPTKMEIAPGQWVTITKTGAMPAKPFLTPAVDEKYQEVWEKITERLYKGILRQATELTKKYGQLTKATKKRLVKS